MKTTTTNGKTPRAIKPAADVKAIVKEEAREQVRRELAAWIMATRSQFEALRDSVQQVLWAARDEDSLLHGLLDTNRLTGIQLDLEAVDGSITLLTVECAPTDVVAIAESYQKNWPA